MDAVTYLKIEKRMCEGRCEDCPLSSFHNGTNLMCSTFAHTNPEKAVELVEKWAKEHPLKTYKDDFLEKHPKARLGSNDNPPICRKFIYGGEGCTKPFVDDCCASCWNEPMEV